MNYRGADTFPLIMISAMYENGGNTTLRLLDGHPELYVYPFESQVGTRHVHDQWTSMYPQKYRWPEFLLSNDLTSDFRAIIDEETKVRARTPHVSKFRHHAFDLDDGARCARFVELMDGLPRTRGNLASAFFAATFDVWHDLKRSGRERAYVGYSPIIGIDTDKILTDLPAAHVLHVVRNPWSAYAETKRRPVPLPLAHYVQAWCSVQAAVLAAKQRTPDRVHIVRFEDIAEDPREALTSMCESIGCDPEALVPVPTWNSAELDEIYPWGTIKVATPAANRERYEELSETERSEVTRYAGLLLNPFAYEALFSSVAAL